MAGVHRLHREQRPCPVPGDRGLVSFPLRGNEPAGRTGVRAAPAAALWSRHARQIVPPGTRQTRSRAARGTGVNETLKRSQRLERRASRCAWCHAVRRDAAVQFTRSPALRWSPEEVRAARAPLSPPHSPHGAPIHR